MVKRIASIIVVLIILTFSVLSAETKDRNKTLEVKINDISIWLNEELQPFFNEENGHILFPLRCVAEALNYKVEWNENIKRVLLLKEDIEMRLRVNRI